MASYDIPLAEAFWEFPIAVAIVLMPIYAERNSSESTGPNYAQDAAVEARNNCRQFLKEHFTIVDDPALPWQLK